MKEDRLLSEVQF